MEKKEKIKLSMLLLEKTYGKFRVMQDYAEKIQIIRNALNDILKNDTPGQFKRAKEELNVEEVQQSFINEFLSYDQIDKFLGDFNCEDIIINSLNPIYIHHGSKGLIATDKKFTTLDDLNLFIKKLIVFSGRQTFDPIMNIELPNLEGRVNIVKSPFGPQLTITKAKSTPLSIIELIETGAMSYEVAAQLWLYLEGMAIRPANMIIAGGPGVGKTTLLNALFSFIPQRDRMVIMEDTLELNSDFEDSCSRLECGEDFDLADLVKNSLRMRPERIVIGEVRGSEARDMMTAANVGKYCIGTIHALTSREAIIRLQNEPMNIPEDLIRLIDVFIVLKRYHVEGKVFRVVDEVSETSGMEQEKVLLSHIYKYDYETKTIKTMATSTVYRDRLARGAGLLGKDILLEVQLRAFLLQQLAERDLKTIREVTSFCRAYSVQPDVTVRNLGFDRAQLLGRK
ncbi:MAG TPA: ATPase, T2SS/T4P/T4SS family [Candidatus Omnitrophota bacterium]|nr:CpaF family protein [Candidatus Omnitrophota bacterium]HQO58626.1 ATPase, T2SS/T4P/T4SS family [Candidatus Omnitrophota bacterium]